MINQRDIHSFDGIENELIIKGHVSSKLQKEMDELLFNLNTSPKAGMDRLRLLCIYIMGINPKKSEVRNKIQR